MIDDYVTTSIRLPKYLYERIKASAATNYRTLNLEIGYRLAQSLPLVPASETVSPDSTNGGSDAQQPATPHKADGEA